MKTMLSILGGILITACLYTGVSFVMSNKNPDNTITTSGGLVVKMGKVTAELAQTKIDVGSGATLMVPIADAAKEVANLMDQAGVKDTDLLKGNLTVCLASAVTYKTELNGLITTKLGQQCRNFTPGMMAATIKTFAEDYTATSVTDYKTNHTFINKGSK